jgi:hypothetical protein
VCTAKSCSVLTQNSSDLYGTPKFHSYFFLQGGQNVGEHCKWKTGISEDSTATRLSSDLQNDRTATDGSEIPTEP